MKECSSCHNRAGHKKGCKNYWRHEDVVMKANKDLPLWKLAKFNSEKEAVEYIGVYFASHRQIKYENTNT